MLQLLQSPRIKCLLFAQLLTLCCSAQAAHHATAETEHVEAQAVVLQMVEAWNAVDLERVVSLFAEDGVLHSMMTDPIVGREQLRHHLGPLFAGIERLELKLKHLVVSGDTVFMERVDEFVFAGRKGAVPVVGVLQVRDGEVVQWREYYDRAQLYAEMGIPVPDRNAPAASTHRH